MAQGLQLSWTKPQSLTGCTDCTFQYTYSVNGGAYITPITVAFNVTSISLRNFVSGGNYIFKVRTICGEIQSDWVITNQITAPIIPTLTPTPTNTVTPTVTPTITPSPSSLPDDNIFVGTINCGVTKTVTYSGTDEHDYGKYKLILTGNTNGTLVKISYEPNARLNRFIIYESNSVNLTKIFDSGYISAIGETTFTYNSSKIYYLNVLTPSSQVSDIWLINMTCNITASPTPTSTPTLTPTPSITPSITPTITPSRSDVSNLTSWSLYFCGTTTIASLRIPYDEGLQKGTIVRGRNENGIEYCYTIAEKTLFPPNIELVDEHQTCESCQQSISTTPTPTPTQSQLNLIPGSSAPIIAMPSNVISVNMNKQYLDLELQWSNGKARVNNKVNLAGKNYFYFYGGVGPLTSLPSEYYLEEGDEVTVYLAIYNNPTPNVDTFIDQKASSTIRVTKNI